jgi:hypothetical protein
MHSNKRLYFLDYSSEKTNIWIDYLKIGKYKEAEKNCKNHKYMSLISGLVGDQLFARGNYRDSVVYYSKSNKSFEEVALKFLNTNQQAYLCYYLEKFLERVKLLSKTNHLKDYKPQKILLSTWIVELKLSEINKLKYETQSYNTDSE